jgi:hypothetical protein
LQTKTKNTSSEEVFEVFDNKLILQATHQAVAQHIDQGTL